MAERRQASLLDLAIAASIVVVPVMLGVMLLVAVVRPTASDGAGVHLIGGADVAAELDAKRAIKQGTELAARL